MHPAASGEALGATSLRDFRYFTSFVARLEGGVYLNCGSAVLLPEVFLKAVSLVRNRGISLDGLTTVNLDFVRLYRPETNVVRRPVAGIGRGYSITGHHELMLPLLAAAADRSAGRDLTSGFFLAVWLTSKVTAGVAQWLEHAAHIRSVRGSSPCTGTIFNRGREATGRAPMPLSQICPPNDSRARPGPAGRPGGGRALRRTGFGGARLAASRAGGRGRFGRRARGSDSRESRAARRGVGARRSILPRARGAARRCPSRSPPLTCGPARARRAARSKPPDATSATRFLPRRPAGCRPTSWRPATASTIRPRPCCCGCCAARARAACPASESAAGDSSARSSPAAGTISGSTWPNEENRRATTPRIEICRWRAIASAIGCCRSSNRSRPEDWRRWPGSPNWRPPTTRIWSRGRPKPRRASSQPAAAVSN